MRPTIQLHKGIVSRNNMAAKAKLRSIANQGRGEGGAEELSWWCRISPDGFARAAGIHVVGVREAAYHERAHCRRVHAPVDLGEGR